MRDTESLTKLLQSLSNLPQNTPATILLFASPQILVYHKEVEGAIKYLLKNKLLRLVAYDEIHLFSEFGRIFWKEFSLLPNLIDTPVCQLLMTATCNKEIKVSIKNLLSLSVNYAGWGNNKEQEMRKVDIGLSVIHCRVRWYLKH